MLIEHRQLAVRRIRLEMNYYVTRQTPGRMRVDFEALQTHVAV